MNATGNWAYYLDDTDRMAWLRRLTRMLDRFDCVCVAFCQMDTHVHLILELRGWSLPEAMRFLNREYSKDFNLRHKRIGAFQRKRYGNRRIEDGADLVGTYAYVVLNPVRELMCRRAELWHWSSYATTIGLRNDFPFVDASAVLAELDASVSALRAVVAGRAVEVLAARYGHVR